MGDGRGVESKKTRLPLHHPAACRWNKGRHLFNSIGWVYYLVRSRERLLDYTVFHCFLLAIHFVWLGGNYQMDKWFGKTHKATKAICWRFVVPKAYRIYCSIKSETCVLLLPWVVLFITACPGEQKGQHLISSYKTRTRIHLGSICARCIDTVHSNETRSLNIFSAS